MSIEQEEKTSGQLREFGEVMALACLVFAALGIYKRAVMTLLILGFLLGALFFLTMGFFRPQGLRLIEKKWMVFAEKLGTVVTFLVMLVTFFLVITPIGLFMRLLRSDLLKMRLDPQRPSYWEKVEQDGPGSRHYLPY